MTHAQPDIPTRGVAFRLYEQDKGVGPWVTDPDAFFNYPSDAALDEAIHVGVHCHTSEIAWSLLESALGSRTPEEGQPTFARVYLAWRGEVVLWGEASIEWGEPEEDDGDSRPYASPWACGIDETKALAALRSAARKQLRQARRLDRRAALMEAAQ